MSEQEWWGAEGESWKTGSADKRERQEAYIDWLVTPKGQRDPRTKKELAEQLGVTPATLRNYEKEPFVQREVVRRGRGLAKVERAADVLDALYARATGDTDKDSDANAAARIWLDWIDRETRGGEEADLSQLSDEDLIAKFEELSSALRNRQ